MTNYVECAVNRNQATSLLAPSYFGNGCSWIFQIWCADYSCKILAYASPILPCSGLIIGNDKWMIIFLKWYKQQQQSFYGPLSGTARVSRYQNKHSPTHHPDQHPVFIRYFHLLRSIASSLFKLRAWQSFRTTSVQVLFGLPLGLELSTFCTFLHPISVFFSQYTPIPSQPVLLVVSRL